MARGGKRAGAGRKAGSANNRATRLEATVASLTGKKATEAVQRLADVEQASPDLMPLDYMLSLMRDEAEPKGVRMLMAEKAAPYVHAKLSTVDMTAKVGLTTQEDALKALM